MQPNIFAHSATSAGKRYNHSCNVRRKASDCQNCTAGATNSCHVAANPGTSTRRISSAEGVHHSTVWRILHEDRLCPYHLQRVQILKPEDLPRRVRFCQWCLEQCVQHPQFLWKLLLTDEAMFTRDGIFNFNNVHVWTHANPHAIREANVDELWERIVATFDAIRNGPGQLERVR